MQEPMRIKHKSRSPTRETGLPTRRKDYSHPLLKMQRSVGNRAMLQMRNSLETIQTKLSLGQPNDIYEEEADTVARRVVSQISRTDGSFGNPAQEPSQQVQMLQRQEEEQPDEEEKEEDEELVQPSRIEQLQRQVEEEEEEEEESPAVVQPRLLDHIQRQEEEPWALPKRTETNHSEKNTSSKIPHSLENKVQSARHSGEPMDRSLRTKMENGFGYDFSQVNIHTDSVSDHISRQLNAEAFTIKDDIFFRNGRFNPTSTQGQDLLAHELTHVVQQGAASSRDTNTIDSI